MGVFIVVDRRASAAVLPRRAFEPGPLKWIYLTLGLLMASTMVDMYVPLFGQRLGGLAPVVAGFLGAALSVGWTVGGEIASASITNVRTTVRVVAIAPLVMATGLALAAATQTDGAPTTVVVLWAVALVITGSGIGMAWPHLSAWAMGSVIDDAPQQAVAAAAISTVQLMCGAFGAGLAGVVVNVRVAPDASASRLMFGAFAVLAAAGGCVAPTVPGVNGRTEAYSSFSSIRCTPVTPAIAATVVGGARRIWVPDNVNMTPPSLSVLSSVRLHWCFSQVARMRVSTPRSTS